MCKIHLINTHVDSNCLVARNDEASVWFCNGTYWLSLLALSMLRLLSSKAQGRNIFRRLFKPCHVAIHWIALAMEGLINVRTLMWPIFSQVDY